MFKAGKNLVIYAAVLLLACGACTLISLVRYL